MKKKIDIEVALTTLKTELMLAKFKMKRYFDSFPDASDGVEIDYEDFKEVVLATEAYFIQQFKGLFGSVPDIPDIPEPVPTPTPTPSTTPAPTPTNEEFTLTWEGSESDKSDRKWWTKIGGDDWFRKWTLPDWVEDTALILKFIFDNGEEFTVPNPTTMKMNAGGPKYLPAKKDDANPDKRHPKISEPSSGSGCKSVRVIVIRKGGSPSTPVLDPNDVDLPDISAEFKDRSIVVHNTGEKMSWNGRLYDKFVFPHLGPEYTTKSFVLEFSDGNILKVHDPENMTMTPDNMKYQPGGKYSSNNPDIPTMEVYARRGTHPEYVTAIFQHDIPIPFGNDVIIEDDGQDEDVTCGNDFSLRMEMIVQKNAESGWYFDKAYLLVEHTFGTNTYRQDGELLVKKNPHRTGVFKAMMSDIPCSASILKATLTMVLNRHEGIANDDKEGIVEVRDGNTGEFIRNITARTDIYGNGYNKYERPNVEIDFTLYARKIHGK